MQLTEERVYQALKQVIDPELGINIVALGLIYEVKISEERRAESEELYELVSIEMTLTTPGCPLAPYFVEQVPAVVAQNLDIEVEQVKLNFTFDPPWTRDMINEEAMAELGLN